MKIYAYAGDGAGVPGLPKVITQSEVDNFNPEQIALLQDAVAEGLYTVEGEEEKPKPKPKKIALTDEAQEKGA